MEPIDLNESATVFIGPDMEGRMTIRRDTHHFKSLTEALVWAVDEMDHMRRWGAYIVTASGSRYEWEQIGAMRATIAPTRP